NEDIQIVSEKSSIQRMIDEKGALAGASEWASNQVAVFVGDNRVNKIKREGIVGGIKDEEVGADGSKAYDITGATSTSAIKKEIEENLKKETSNIPYALFTFKQTDGSDTKEYYTIIKTSNWSNTGDKKCDYESINYTEDLNLPNSLLTKMIGKTEKTDLNIKGTVKGE
ncbi:MAG: hypothetical protein K2M23_00370, partial [Alphaproteobacteria bacterium]|nr:hypothetical protein [Alphaproteobacteria bacterium]